jgi:hypothetical protein
MLAKLSRWQRPILVALAIVVVVMVLALLFLTPTSIDGGVKPG